EVIDHGRRLALHGVKQRATLGFLLLHANRPVPTSELLTALWPTGAPPTARKILQNAVSALRGTLAASAIGAKNAELLSRPPGYLLQIEPRCLDLACFDDLARRGRVAL